MSCATFCDQYSEQRQLSCGGRATSKQRHRLRDGDVVEFRLNV